MDDDKFKAYYEVLELEENASSRDITSAYNALKKLYSAESMVMIPMDEEFGNEDKQEVLEEIETAYQVLIRYSALRESGEIRDEEEDSSKGNRTENEIASKNPLNLLENYEPIGRSTFQQETVEDEPLFESPESYPTDPLQTNEPADVSEDELLFTASESSTSSAPEQAETVEALDTSEEKDTQFEDSELSTPEQPETVEVLDTSEEKDTLFEDSELSMPEQPETVDIKSNHGEDGLLFAGHDLSTSDPEDTVEAVEIPSITDLDSSSGLSDTVEAPAKPVVSAEPVEVSEEPSASSDPPFKSVEAFPPNHLEDTIVEALDEEDESEPAASEPKIAVEVNDSTVNPPLPPPDKFSSGGVPITGRSIKAIREKQGVGVHEIAVSTKISYKILVNIEQERYDQLPEGGYLRWVVMTYAKALNLDPREVADQYMKLYRKWEREKNN